MSVSWLEPGDLPEVDDSAEPLDAETDNPQNEDIEEEGK